MLRFARLPLLFLSCSLLVPLASCANTPTGDVLQRSLEADPQLNQTVVAETPQPSVSPSPSPTPATAPTPTTSPAPTAQTGTLAALKSFSDSVNLGIVGSSDGRFTIGNPTGSSTASSPTGATEFTDLDQTPKPLQTYVQDVVQLGVLSAAAPDANPDANKEVSRDRFGPNQSLTRREYARWLVAVNNRLFSDQPANQIRLASSAAQPAFKDVPTSDPDFAAIQGLAEAGIIPSPLSGQSTTVTFRPDAPVTRETLLLWKVPLDMRQPLPKASVEAVQETWGFQDAARIDPTALRAVLADYQNGELANIRRILGYTTLFQPKKTVTRAEAAATLWYFGYQGEGQSAQSALNGTSASPRPAPSVSPSPSPTSTPIGP